MTRTSRDRRNDRFLLSRSLTPPTIGRKKASPSGERSVGGCFFAGPIAILLGTLIVLLTPLSGLGASDVSLSGETYLWDTLTRYNTRIVLLGTTILGISGGVVGVFMLLRKRSLVGDVVGHASLPGITIAFLVMESLQPGTGRTLSGLLIGATVSALAGVLCTLLIVNYSRIKEDAALAIVLSIFYGLGISLFTVIQSIPSGSSAGLRDFIFGKAALMVQADVELIAQASFIVLIVCALLFKEFSLLCFDEEFATALGWPTTILDLLLMSIVVAVTVVGLQSVGLILVVAILIIPAAAARFWSDHLLTLTVIAACLGGASAFLGVLASSLIPKLATGAIIVVVNSALFLVSLLFGPKRGIVYRVWNQQILRQRVGQHDLLRAVFEVIESKNQSQSQAELLEASVTFDDLLSWRTWSPVRVRRLLRRARSQDLLWQDAQETYRLTPQGADLARRAVRNHRMWELFLIHHADIAPGHVDRDADRIEHILEPAMIAELESLMKEDLPPVPQSPHEIATSPS
jgi:manganese/zinc/iron transport system permease protein